MIANFFNKSKPVYIIYLLILLLVYYTVSCILTYNNEPITGFLLKNSGIFLVNIGSIFLVNFIVFKNKLIYNNYFPLLLLVIFYGIFNESMFNSNFVLSNFFLLLAFRKIFSLKSQINTKGKIFDASFWIGLALFFYEWNILFLALVYISIVVYKKANFKNLIIPIIGLITPAIIYFTYLFYYDSLPGFYSHFNFEYSFVFQVYKSHKILIPLVVFSVVLAWSILKVSPRFMLVNNVQKYSWIVVLWLVFISILVLIAAPQKNGSEFLFVLFPSAIIIGNLIQVIESPHFKNVILYLFLLLSIVVNFL